MQQYFMRATKPHLPDFNKNDVDTWLDICNKKFDDFDIDDPMIKYQMITSALGTEEINRMAPYMSRGNRNEYYDNFVTGLIKVFGTTRRQKFRQAQEVKFSADDLPSTLANKLRTTLPVKDFSNEAIIDFVRDKFSDELCFLMTPYDHLDWEDYLGMADKFYLNRLGSIVQHSQKEESGFSKSKLAILQMMSSVQDSLQQQNDKLKSLSVSAVKQGETCDRVRFAERERDDSEELYRVNNCKEFAWDDDRV